MTTSEEQYRARSANRKSSSSRFCAPLNPCKKTFTSLKIKQHKQELFDALGDLFPPLTAATGGVFPTTGAGNISPAVARGGRITSKMPIPRSSPVRSLIFIVCLFSEPSRFLAREISVCMAYARQLTDPAKILGAGRGSSPLAELETPIAGVEATTGVMHRPAAKQHGEYSLYVPENYDPQPPLAADYRYCMAVMVVEMITF